MKNEPNWYDYPQKIKNWSKDIDYVMFVDENNSIDKQQLIYKKIVNKQQIPIDEKYFTITGCIFEKSNYSKMRNSVRKLKEKYWQNGYYYDTKFKESRYVCLRFRDIRRHDGAFNNKIINYDNFINDLSNLLKEVDCKVISISINIEDFIKKGYTNSIYEIAFDFLLERFIYATKNKKHGIIILESRGKKDDKNLLKHIYDIIYKQGRDKISKKELQNKINGIYFNPKWYGGHSSTFAGLEIADLFSYPIHQYIKYQKTNRSFDIIKKNIVGYPNAEGKGIKVFPKEKDSTSHL